MQEVGKLQTFKSGFEKRPGSDPEVLERPVLEPPTELEKQGKKKLDDIGFEIFRHKIDSIVDEGRSVFEGLGMAESLQIGDVNVAIHTALGDMAASACGIAFHAILNYGPIKYILKYYKDDPTVGLKDGDIFFFNSATAGVVHPYDMFVAMPIFSVGELMAWAACGGHQGEAGGKDPGGFCPSAKTRYEEGFHVPALKIGENFEIKRDHLDLLASFVRNPHQLALDIKTRVAVCMRVRNRLLREAERRGADLVAAGLRETIRRSGQEARERLKSFNDGIYRAVIFLDTIGVDDGLLRVPVALIKEDDHLTIDFTKASPQHGKGPIHMYWHLVRATTAVYLTTHVFRGLTLNIGLYDPIDVITPKGSFINASSGDFAHGAGSYTGRVVVQALEVAGAKMIFDSAQRPAVSAPFAANLLIYFVGGIDQYGNSVAGIPSSTNAGGQGARNDMDGEHCMGFFWCLGSVDCLSAEENENKFPYLYLSRNMFEKNQHGYGKYRGGVGMCDIYTIHNVPSVLSGANGHGDLFSLNVGLFGGYSGPTTPRLVIKNSNLKEMMAQTDENLPYGMYELAQSQSIRGDYVFERGNLSAIPHTGQDLLVMMQGSGGGYGDVIERDPNFVIKDLKEGLITEEVARKIYRVAFDPKTLEIDYEKTEKFREEERRDRKRRGLPYDAFIEKWSKKKPPEEALKYYGPWPEPDPKRDYKL